MSRLINSVIAVQDLNASLRFYCEGLGLVVISDHEFNSPFAPLIGPTDGFPQHQAHLADPEDVGVTMLELVETRAVAGLAPLQGPPYRGPFMVGFQCDYDNVVARLRQLGYTDINESVLDEAMFPGASGGSMKIGFLRDPDGTVVELVSLDFPAASARLRKQGVVRQLEPWPNT